MKALRRNKVSGITGPQRTRVRNRESREAALLSAAGKLFAARGYEATTTREIAACAGCAEGLISRYFRGKAGLVHALILPHTYEKQFLSSHTPPVNTNFEEQIVQLVAAQVERTWQERDFLAAIIPQALGKTGACAILSKSALLKRSETILYQLKRSNHCRLLSDEELISLARLIDVTAFMFGFWCPRVLKQDPDSAKECAMTMARLITKTEAVSLRESPTISGR